MIPSAPPVTADRGVDAHTPPLAFGHYSFRTGGGDFRRAGGGASHRGPARLDRHGGAGRHHRLAAETLYPGLGGRRPFRPRSSIERRERRPVLTHRHHQRYFDGAEAG